MVASAHQLVQFMRARLDEEAEQARRAGGIDWMPLTAPRFSSPGDRGEIEIGDNIVIVPTPDVALHIAHHDPARVLADVKAKRTVLDAWEDMDYDVPDYVIEALAAPYSDHPDYPKW